MAAWNASGVPWAPELFSAPALQRLRDKYRRERLRAVPFFDGLLSGEVDALVESFAGVPEVHHPVRGRIKGEPAAYPAQVGLASFYAGHRKAVHAPGNFSCASFSSLFTASPNILDCTFKFLIF